MDLPERVRLLLALQSLSSLLGAQVVVVDDDAHDRHAWLRCFIGLQAAGTEASLRVVGSRWGRASCAYDVEVPGDHMGFRAVLSNHVEPSDSSVSLPCYRNRADLCGPVQGRTGRLSSTAEAPHGKIAFELLAAQILFAERLLQDVEHVDLGVAEAIREAADLGPEQDIQVTLLD